MGPGLSKVIRVRYERGVLKPLEPVEFTEGEELILEIKKHVGRKGIARFFGVIKARKDAISTEEEDYYEYISERGSVSR